MSIQDLASLAEVLGVIGLLVSLVYVARQLKQNTLQMRVGAAHDRLQVFIHFYHSVAKDREFATLFHSGGNELSTLDEVDQFRLLMFQTAGLMVWSHLFDLHQADLLSEQNWREQTLDMETIGQRADVRAAWDMNKARFGPPFRQFMAQYME